MPIDLLITSHWNAKHSIWCRLRSPWGETEVVKRDKLQKKGHFIATNWKCDVSATQAVVNTYEEKTEWRPTSWKLEKNIGQRGALCCSNPSWNGPGAFFLFFFFWSVKSNQPPLTHQQMWLLLTTNRLKKQVRLVPQASSDTTLESRVCTDLIRALEPPKHGILQF